jgi:hypothetical protein
MMSCVCGRLRWESGKQLDEWGKGVLIYDDVDE